jgi:F-type H+-transporting ATPase subunit g
LSNYSLSVYNAKVGAELAKLVYKKEGMAFPSGQQFAEARSYVEKNLNKSAFKGLTLRDLAKGGVVAAEFYTFFLFGEIIGRRNLIGYNVPSEKHADH